MCHSKNCSYLSDKNRQKRSRKVTISAPLADNAESSSPPPAQYNPHSNETREKRYRLQWVGQELLLKYAKSLGMDMPQNFHNTIKCLRTRFVPEVSVNATKSRAFYGGLIVCDNPWACSICSVRIQEERRKEIGLGIDWSYENGFKSVMVTFTFPHALGENLKDLLDKQALAFKYFRGGEAWKRFKHKFGFVGLIRSLECPHGKANGWHPHTHEAWIVSNDADANALHERVRQRWWDMCLKVGLVNESDKEAFWLYGVNVQDRIHSSEYLSKLDGGKSVWGADAELAKGAVKNSKGRHVFELLRLADNGDKGAGKLYVEFVLAMKGKPPVYWSPGLKAKVGIDEVKDEEIKEAGSSEQEKAWELLGLLDRDQWTVVLLNKLRTKVLEAAEKDGFDGVLKLLEDTVQANLDFFNNTS